MMVSTCCKEKVVAVLCDEGTCYYSCAKCEHACDTEFSLNLEVGEDDAEV